MFIILTTLNGKKNSFRHRDFRKWSLPSWEPLDQLTTIHGTFEVVNNPEVPLPPTHLQKLENMQKDHLLFSTLAAVAPSIIDISVKPQYNVQVWAPVGAKSVIAQLESVSAGNKEVERSIKKCR